MADHLTEEEQIIGVRFNEVTGEEERLFKVVSTETVVFMWGSYYVCNEHLENK